MRRSRSTESNRVRPCKAPPPLNAEVARTSRALAHIRGLSLILRHRVSPESYLRRVTLVRRRSPELRAEHVGTVGGSLPPRAWLDTMWGRPKKVSPPYARVDPHADDCLVRSLSRRRNGHRDCRPGTRAYRQTGASYTAGIRGTSERTCRRHQLVCGSPCAGIRLGTGLQSSPVAVLRERLSKGDPA